MKGSIHTSADIDEPTMAAMYMLLCEQFDGVSFKVFRDDLAAKAWVLLLRDDAGALCGFSSMDLYDIDVGGRTVSVVYSGIAASSFTGS